MMFTNQTSFRRTGMLDRFEGKAQSFESPAANGFGITPNDATDLAEVTRALYVGGAGDVQVTLLSGATLTFSNVNAGTFLPIRAVRVLATGTTASAIVGLS